METRKRWVVGASFASLLAGGWWLSGHARAHAQAVPTSEAQRQNIELTVYNEDFGMVREARPLQLKQGGNRLGLPGVSNELDPQSVSLQWEGGREAPQLIAQSYDLGVASGDALLKRYLGKQVEVVRYGENGKEAERQKGTLMVQANGQFVLDSEGHFYVQPPGTLVVPTEGDIVTIPQLALQADSPTAQSLRLQMAYLTRGLAWSADYVATLAPTQDTLDLECWATVTNRTGVDYPDARVTLIAGSPNRAVVAAQDRAGKAPISEASYLNEEVDKRSHVRAKSAFGRPQTVGDFHAYSLSAPTTVVQEQMNRLLMFSSHHVILRKDYNTRLPELGIWDDNPWTQTGPGQQSDVAVSLSFYNSQKNQLGEPLPRGAIRLYEPDSTGSLRYAGAASVQDTPQDQRIDLTLARAFDLTTQWRFVKRIKINKHTVRKEIEVTLHNEKASPASVRVVQAFGNHWKIVQEPQKHTEVHANTAQWKILIPAKSKAEFRYTVDLTE